MVAVLRSCEITGNIVPIDLLKRPIPTLASKLAVNKPLTASDMSRVMGFRTLLEVNSRVPGIDNEMFLVLRMVLMKGTTFLAKYEVMDVFTPRATVVSSDYLPIPRSLGSFVGSWKISIGYAALQKREITPRCNIPELLPSLPYTFKLGNQLGFQVVENEIGISPNGEWSESIDANGMAGQGSTSPEDI